jgi:hypothetical protein
MNINELHKNIGRHFKAYENSLIHTNKDNYDFGYACRFRRFWKKSNIYDSEVYQPSTVVRIPRPFVGICAQRNT